MAGARRRGRPRTAWIIIIIIIIIHEYYYGGAVALLLQDHLTMSASRRESIYRETLPKQHSFQSSVELVYTNIHNKQLKTLRYHMVTAGPVFFH